MWPFPFDVWAGPLGRLHWVDVQRAIVGGEVRVRPWLLRVLDKLFNLVHHLTHLVLR